MDTTEPASPTFTFSIPSLTDDGVHLDCRIYHPNCDIQSPAWVPKAAVIAHPYAPLGGCQDDPIVLALTGLLLSHDYIVGTFNFRGASPSSGHTSWTAKPEICDYTSFTSLLATYLQKLLLHHQEAEHASPALLLLAGYSYGALVTTLLPSSSPSSLLAPLVSPSPNTPAQTIKLRADHLATSYLSSPPRTSLHRGRRSSTKDLLSPVPAPVTVGSAEALPNSGGARSPNSRRSLDTKQLRQSIDRARERLQQHLQRSSSENADAPADGGTSTKSDSAGASGEDSPDRVIAPRSQLRVAYLLVAPPLGSVASLATLFSASALKIGQDKFVGTDTLLVYGDRDVFTGQTKYKRWCEELSQQSIESQRQGKTFRWRGIQGAGHFWTERGVERQMRDAVGEWVERLARGV